MKKSTLLKYVLPPSALLVSAWIGVEIYNATLTIYGELSAQTIFSGHPLLGLVSTLTGVFLGCLGFAASLYTIAKSSGYSKLSRKEKQSKRQEGRAS